LGVLNEEIYELSEEQKVVFLKKIVSVFEEYDVDYWLEFGSLLGCYRDKRLIPWDSDIDIGVFDLEAVRKAKRGLEEQGLIVVEKPENFMPTLEIYCKDFPEESYFHADIYQFIKNSMGMYEYRWLVRTNLLCRIANYIAYIFRQQRVVNASRARVRLTDDLISISKWFPKSVNKVLHDMCMAVDLFFSNNRKLLFKDFETKTVMLYDTLMRIPETAEEHLLINYGRTWRIPQEVTQTGGCEFISDVVDGVEVCRLPEDDYDRF